MMMRKYICLLIGVYSIISCSAKPKEKLVEEVVDSIFAKVSTGLNVEKTDMQDSFILGEPDDKYRLSFFEMDSTEYTDLYEKYHKNEADPFVIISADSIRSALGTKIDLDETEYSTFVTQIKPNNGKTIKFDEVALVAYYPEYNFVLLEGGHTTEMGFDLVTGLDIYEAGNPATQTLSPDKNIRISGVYGGQECSTYIIQILDGGRYKKIGEIGQDRLCYYVAPFWENSNTFCYSIHDQFYDFENERGPMKYYKIKIEKVKNDIQ